MVRLFLKFLALLLLAAAFAALIVDGTRSVAAGKAALLPLGRTLAILAPNLLLAVHKSLEAHVPVLWDPVCVTVLLAPSWLVLGAAGLVLLALTRPPAPKIGYARR